MEDCNDPPSYESVCYTSDIYNIDQSDCTNNHSADNDIDHSVDNDIDNNDHPIDNNDACNSINTNNDSIYETDEEPLIVPLQRRNGTIHQSHVLSLQRNGTVRDCCTVQIQHYNDQMRQNPNNIKTKEQRIKEYKRLYNKFTILYLLQNPTIDNIKTYTSLGKDINEDENGMTLLMCYIKFGMNGIALYLVNHIDIDLSKTDHTGCTALHYAIEYSQMTIVKDIISSRITINHKNNDGDTPLHYAVRYYKHIVQLLLDNGADPNITNNYNKRPCDQIGIDSNTINLLKRYTIDVRSRRF